MLLNLVLCTRLMTLFLISGQYRVQLDRMDVGVLLLDDSDVILHDPVPLLYQALCTIAVSQPSPPRSPEGGV